MAVMEATSDTVSCSAATTVTGHEIDAVRCEQSKWAIARSADAQDAWSAWQVPDSRSRQF